MCHNVIIDGDKVDSEHDFHRAIATALEFGAYYGNNTDALWDMLSSGMACGVCLHWKKSSISRKKLGPTFDIIISLFEKAKDRYQGKGKEKEFNFILE